MVTDKMILKNKTIGKLFSIPRGLFLVIAHMKDFKNIESIFDSYIPCRSKSHFPKYVQMSCCTVNS